MDKHYTQKDTRYGFGDTKINISYFHHMLLEGKYEERLDHLNEEEEEYYTEAFWTYTNDLWEQYIQYLCRGVTIFNGDIWGHFYEKCINDEEWVRYLEQLFTEITD